jgi:hypothetical protein
MRKGETKGDDKLQHLVWTRVNDKKYKELISLLTKTKDETLSGLVRNILQNRTIKVYTHDETTDLLLEELASLRTEIKAIGVNFNQITRYFNTYPEDAKKRFYAKIGFEKYQLIEEKIDRLLALISNLCKKWLSG